MQTFLAPTFYVNIIQIMNTYLVHNMQSLCHFNQQTYIWFIHFENGHVIQFPKEQYLIRS